MNRDHPGQLGLSGVWIRFFINFFPAEFRRNYGNDMLIAFLDRRDDAIASHSKSLGLCAVVVTTMRTGWQYARAGIAERRLGARRNREFRRRHRNEPMLAAVISDLKYALRGHLRRPGLVAIAVITLALGIGASTAIFSAVNGVLLRPLAYPNSQELISIQVSSGICCSEGFYELSEPEYLDLAAQISSFSEVAGYSGTEVTMGDSLSARRIQVMRTTANLFPLLRVNPLLGRTFSSEEDLPDVPRVVLLGYGMWQAEFGGDPNVVGRSVVIADRPVTIIGVMPAGFEFPAPGVDAYIQLQIDRENPWARNNHYLPTIARLAPGATIEQARSEVNVLAARSTEDYPEYYPNTGYQIQLRSFQDSIVGLVKTPLYILLAAVGFVLLTACVNVANLLLAHGEARKREIAIRAAIGASGGRVTRQLLTESFLLAALGGVAGLGVAVIGVDALVAMAPSAVPRLDEIGIDGTVLGFSLLAAIATGLLFGVIPATHATRQDVQEVLKEGGGARGGVRSGHALRRTLVTTQVMLAVVLVTGSGLMLRSVINMYNVDKGFETDNILTFRINPSSSRYDTEPKRVSFYTQLLERMNALPGVAAAAAVHSLPMTGWSNNWSIIIEGRPVANIGEAPADLVQRVTPEYFDALGLTLVRGRLFTHQDDAASPPVVVISEAMAQKHWPGEDAIGKRMKVFRPSSPWIEVIGIVKDVRHQGPSQEPRPRWYVPHAQAYVSAYSSPLSTTIAVRSDSDPTPLMGPIRSLMTELDASVPISNIRTMEQILDGAVGRQRFVTTLLIVFGLLALFLAVVGVYGVISYTVSQRTHEIGLRMALGAKGSNVLTQVMREGLVLSLIGLGVGLAGSIALSRAFESMVFGITPTDPVTYGSVVIVLILAAAAATLLPARRASRVDPMMALREE
ncbi:MAG: ABC transporter permease [Gemmatimonadota bacterium]|nr:MAG: ABC transporter permease [Gemmatimonadota bacterium]